MPAKVTSSPVEAGESPTEDTVVEDTAGPARSTVAEPSTDQPAVDEPSTEVDEPAVEDEATVVDEPAAEPEPAAAEPAAEDEPAAAEPATVPVAARRSWRPSRWTAVVAALSVLLVALWVAGAFLVVHNRGVSQLAAQRQQVLVAAQNVAGDLTSIGADNAPAQIQKLTGESTGAFRDQIGTYAQALQVILKQSNAGSRGTVSAAGIEKMGPDTASVLVTVTATVSNAQTTGQPVSYRLGVQLQREGDRWLASDVAFVQ
jgi:Mce-associated membrane protein